ncbi:Receptor-like protein 50, partial [Bienertia sinuspersici]
MFKVVQKLKRVKDSMKELKNKGSIRAPDTDLMQKEKDAVYKYNQAHKNYMQYLRQRPKKRTLQNKVYAIRDRDG